MEMAAIEDGTNLILTKMIELINLRKDIRYGPIPMVHMS